MLVRFLSLCSFLLVATYAHAEDYDNWVIDDTYDPIIVPIDNPDIFFLIGEIDLRTSVNFKRAALKYGDPKEFILHSQGGAVHTALELALEVNRLSIDTHVMADSICYSSCAYVFFAGKNRTANGEVGVHQISGENTSLGIGQLVLSDVIDVLNNFDTPPSVFASMLRTPPDEIHILSAEEIASLETLKVTPTETQESTASLPKGFDSRSELEDGALQFVTVLQQLWSGNKPVHPNIISTLYGPNVDYYGVDRSRDFIQTDKAEYFDRWPIRKFEVVPQKFQVVCQGNYCSVRGNVKWSVRSPQRGKAMSGESQFHYQLIAEYGDFWIVKEDGAVIARY